MTRRLLILLGLFALCGAAPARAYDSAGNPTPSDIALAKDYTKIAGAFGDFHIAWIGRSPSMLMVEYTSGDETPDNWTRLVAVKFIGAADEPNLHERQVDSAIAGWRARIDNKADYPVRSTRISFAIRDRPAPPPGDGKLHGAIFHYMAGAGAKREDDAGIVHALPKPSGIVVLQYQTRGPAKISGDDMTKLRRILDWALSTLNTEPAASPVPAIPKGR